ncbi:unnamed protein product [Ascophyllum nodosum]
MRSTVTRVRRKHKHLMPRGPYEYSFQGFTSEISSSFTKVAVPRSEETMPPNPEPSKPDECVKVVVRIRPLSRKEGQDGHKAIAEAKEDRGEIVVRNPRADAREPPKSFFFDAVFGDQSAQERVYEVCGAPLVESVLQGYNGTIFAYGQTGAGKTHTMEGYPDPPELRGIIPKSFEHIFDKIALADNVQYLVRASYLEIYNEEIRDLLSKDPKDKLELKENVDSGVYVKDLKTFVVKSAMEIDHVMQARCLRDIPRDRTCAGKKNRSVGSTMMNLTSSRSHSIFCIVVECSQTDDRGGHIRVGKLNLVDLAGSERQSKTGATGDRLKEANKINLSLSALGNVISALVDGRSLHIPYRDSKLTRLLQDSLGGNTKTVMCANAGPAEYNYDETVSTLRYANRAKNIKNKPKINEDPKDAMLREFQEEIQRLKDQLAGQGGAVDGESEGGQGLELGEGKEGKVVGVSEEELLKLQDDADRREKQLKQQAAEDMKKLLDAHAKTADERQALSERLEKEASERRKIEKTKGMLLGKLQAMEAKLIQASGERGGEEKKQNKTTEPGGEILDKAQRQEAELRQAQHELQHRRDQETSLARELAEKEEGITELNREFRDLEEEVEVKTKKLKKLWSKYQTAHREIKDIQEEFQQERSDMLDTIRELTRQLKLKEASLALHNGHAYVVISNFVPPEEVSTLERRAKWNEEASVWLIPRLELAGNSRRMRRPISAMGLPRPETEYARHRKAYDSNPRYKYDNIIAQDLDLPERTTQEYEGPSMVSRVQPAVVMPLDADEEEVSFPTAADTAPPQPYLQYGPDDSGGGGDRAGGATAGDSIGGERSSRPKSAGMKKKSSRPKSARRRRSLQEEEEGIEFKDDDEMYPTARGLLRK